MPNHRILKPSSRWGRIMSTSCLVAVLLMTAAVSHGQAVKSTILGTVRDSGGLVLPNVSVKVTNLETRVEASTTTDDSGNYNVPFLDSGTYSILVESRGFKTLVQPAFKIDVSAKVRVDMTLEVGDVSERVEVDAATPLVETDSTTLGITLTGEKLRELPLLGRNYQELAQLSPTAVAPTTNHVAIFMGGALSAGNYYQVGGQRGSHVSYTTDGIDTNNVWFQSQSVIPSLDSIEEVRIQSSTFSAEYGRGSVQFTSSTRSGTNDWHGSVYEYIRDEKFNANSFFENRAGVKRPAFRDNQFGFTIGGPILIPKVYNGREKTFFFFGYEGRRRSESITAFTRWPEPEWLSGNFSSLVNPNGTPQIIYDPATTRPNGQGGFIRDPFPGNIIPANRFDRVALAAVQFIPAPNSRGIRPDANHVGSIDNKADVNFWVLRIDHNLSERDRLSGRYMRSQEDGRRTSIAPLSGRILTNGGSNLMLSETHTFSPQTTNELRAGYNRGGYLPNQEGSSGVCLTPCELINYTLDVFGIRNLTQNPRQFGLPNFAWAGFSGIGGQADAPLGGQTKTYQVSDNLITTSGNHYFKTGVDIRHMRFNELAGFGSRGSFGFNGQFTQLPGVAGTGSPFADFLLGFSNSASGLTGETESKLRGTIYALYFQDDWRVSRKLTLNLGVRYENYRPWTEESGRISRFDYGSTPGSCFGAGCPPGSFVSPGPGEPWYDADNNNIGPRLGLAYSPFSDNKTVIRAAYGLYFSGTDANDIAHGIFNPPNALSIQISPQNPFTDFTSTRLSNLFPGGLLPPPGTLLTTDNWTLPAVSPNPYLKTNRDPEIHQWQASVQREVLSNLLVEVGYVGSAGYNGQRRIDYNQARVDNPGQLTSVNSRRPYPVLSNFTANIHIGKSNYQAAFLRLERRFAKGLSFLTAYTFSRNLDDAGNADPPAQNAYDLVSEWGLSLSHAKHRFTAAYVWELPFGRQRQFGSNMHPVLNGFLGGWQVSGITTFQSGSPVNLFPANDASNTGQFFFAQRPNQVGPITYLDIRKTGRQFDGTPFAVPTLGRFGNMSRGALIGPGVNNWDLMISKYFRITERARIQFRMEMFNALNHAQFTNPFPGVGGAFVARTGLVTTTRPPRNIQFAVRLEF